MDKIAVLEKLICLAEDRKTNDYVYIDLVSLPQSFPLSDTVWDSNSGPSV